MTFDNLDKFYDNLKEKYTDRQNEMIECRENANSEAAKKFFLIMDPLLLNYRVIFPVGIANHWSKIKGISSEMGNEQIKFQYHLFYGGVLSTLVTYLEQFFYEFLIENLNDENIKSKDDIVNFLDKKYNPQYHKYYISFQSLKSVKIYFNDLLKINIENTSEYNSLQKILYDNRHIYVHNLGTSLKDNNVLKLIDITAVEYSIMFAKHLIQYIDNAI